jgi:SAM-dependent methyltransferase
MSVVLITKDVIKEAAPLLPDYYCKALARLNRVRPLRGLRVLEVGGYSVPQSVANDMLSVEQWVSIDILDFDGGAYQLENCKEYIEGRPVYPLNSRGVDWTHPNIIIDGDAVEFAETIDQKFDVIFSVNCFEHMQKLISYLRMARNNLKEGGFLFSQFGPIWSSCSGHHIRMDKEIDFAREGFLDNFEHLLLNRVEMLEHLIWKGISRERAEQAVYKIYNSHAVSRYTYDEYIYAFNHAGFSRVDIKDTYVTEIDGDTLGNLQARYPNISNFSTYELTAKCFL